MVELEGKNLFSVLVFNKKNQLLESFGRCCFDDSLKKKDILSIIRKKNIKKK